MAKKEFVGIPIDRNTKQRLKKIAEQKGMRHTVVARDCMLNGMDREEKALGLGRELTTSNK